MNLEATRVKVGCINWTHPDVPHAVVYLYDGDDAGATSYHDTWVEAMSRADRLAGLLLHKVKVMQGVAS